MPQALLAETVKFKPGERLLVVNSAADPCVPALAQRVGEVVLAEDSIAAYARAQAALQRMGKAGPPCRQVAFHEYALHEAPATMDLAVMNILYRPNNAWMRYGVQMAAYALKSDGRLYIEGAKDRGILSRASKWQGVFVKL